MQNIIFGMENGKFYKLSLLPLIYHVALEGTIFNWEYIVSSILSSCIVVTQGGSTQRKSKFYMGSYLIDCNLCVHPFMKLNCTWDCTNTPIYASYQIIWAHKYSSFYKLICKEFLMPLHKLIFLKECNCMFECAMEIICEYGGYYFSKERTYLRMYGGSRALSLIPRYATYYIIHKEAVW